MALADLDRPANRRVDAFVRLLGAALVANVATEVSQGILRVHSGELYPYRHVGLFPLSPPGVLVAEWAASGLAGIAFMLGRPTRLATSLAALGSLALLAERYSNHAALLFLLSFYVALAPPRDLRDAPLERRDRPNIGLARAQIVIVYAFSAFNKILHGFASGDALVALVGVPGRFAPPLAWSVIGAEIAIPILLFVRPSVGVGGVVALHGLFAVTMPGLASFGLAMVAMAVLWLPGGPRAGSAEGRGRRT